MIMATPIIQSTHRFTKERQQTGFKCLVQEMMAEEFDLIRFAAYRTASKLRFIQKRTRFVLLDLCNVVDAFCQCALNTVENNTQLNGDQVVQILSRLYLHIDKRLAPQHRFNWHECVDLLLGWLLHTYDSAKQSTITALALKVSLSTLSSGKLLDKIRYHYSLVCDLAGKLVPDKLECFLHDLLALAVGLFEGPNFSYDSTTSQFILGSSSGCLTIDAFAKGMLSEPGPQCLLWLTIFHRLAFVEKVAHAVRCNVCAAEPLRGFRYQCQQCACDYNLCQQCFWKGATSGQHSNQHEMREFTAWKQSSYNPMPNHSLQKSFHCPGATHTSNGVVGEWSQSNAVSRVASGPASAPLQNAMVTSATTHVHVVPQVLQSTVSQSNYHSLPSTLNPHNNSSAHSTAASATTLQKSMFSISAAAAGTNESSQVGNLAYDSMNEEDQSLLPNSKDFIDSGTTTTTTSFEKRKNVSDTEANTPTTSSQQQQSRNSNQQYHTTSADEADNLINHHGSRSAAIRYQQKQVREHRDKIVKLELKNKEIMGEIERLKNCISEGAANSGFLYELRALRQRKMELDDRMLNLQESRGKLTGQLDVLTRLITPSRATPEMTQFVKTGTKKSSAPDIRHLLQATNCVTAAMGSLVNELGQEVIFNNDFSDHLHTPSLPMYATQNRDSFASSPHGHALIYRQVDPTYDCHQDHSSYKNQLGNTAAPLFYGRSIKGINSDERSFYACNDLDKGAQNVYSTSSRHNRQDGHGAAQSQQHHRSHSLSQSALSDTVKVDHPHAGRDYYQMYTDPENDVSLHCAPARRTRQVSHGSAQSQQHRSNSPNQSAIMDTSVDHPSAGRDYYQMYSDAENDASLHSASVWRSRQNVYNSAQAQQHPNAGREYYQMYSDAENDASLHSTSNRRARQDGHGSAPSQHHRSNSLNQSALCDTVVNNSLAGRDYYHTYSDAENEASLHSTSTRRARQNGHHSAQAQQHHRSNSLNQFTILDHLQDGRDYYQMYTDAENETAALHLDATRRTRQDGYGSSPSHLQGENVYTQSVYNSCEIAADNFDEESDSYHGYHGHEESGLQYTY